MATFSWNPNGTLGGYYYPDPNGQYNFSGPAEADASPAPTGGGTNSGYQMTTQALQSDPTQLATYQQQYAGFKPPDTTTAATQGVNSSQAAENDAMGIISAKLQQIGFTPDQLKQLTSWAWGEITAGASVDQVSVDLQEQPVFQQRFPQIAAMRQAGLNVPSVGEILNLENSYKQAIQSFGYAPPTDPNQLTPLFTGQISVGEFNQRLQDWNDVTRVYGPFLRQQFEQFSGIPTNFTDQDLYGELSGLHTSVSDQYAKATGTPHSGGLSFASIQNAIQYAQGVQKSYTQEGGLVQSGPVGQERQTLEQRRVNLPSAV